MVEWCCGACGNGKASESLFFCVAEEVLLCSACWYRLGEIDRAPRCRPCNQELTADQVAPFTTQARA
jgi:hypothetical protein